MHYLHCIIQKIDLLANKKLTNTSLFLQALGMKSGLANLADLPLAELEEHVLKLLRTYQELKAKRVREFSDIQQRVCYIVVTVQSLCKM